MTVSYRARLDPVVGERGAFCVGIDPHPAILQAWGLDVSATGLETCARRVVEVLGAQTAVFKPQSACYEAFGSAGIAVLERVLADIRDAGAISLLDAKRGDIGSTMDRYADAYLDDASPLRADAVTVSAYLGFESLRPMVDRAHASGRGLYVLCRTSNPEGADVQLAETRGGAEDGASVAQAMVDAARAENRRTGTDAVGLVIGGTHGQLGLDLDGFTGSILVPGIGTQGGTVSGLASLLGDRVGQALPSASREVLGGGPSPEGLRAAVAGVLAA